MVILKPTKRRMLIEKIHEEIKHFGAVRTLAKVNKRFFLHEKIEVIKKFFRACEKVNYLSNMET
jgi:hypothetical protein